MRQEVGSGSLLQQDPQHAPQGFGSPPQQLVTDGECAQVVIAHGHLAQTAIADVVLDNAGTQDELSDQVDALWAQIRAAAALG